MLETIESWYKVKPRKRYQCDGCSRRIPIEAIQYTAVFTYDGDIFRSRLCNPCYNFLHSDSKWIEPEFQEGDILEWVQDDDKVNEVYGKNMDKF